jgi:carbon-monoxide dehydrogenase medium subunit
MALYDSFKNVKPVQIRNVATIGGEICSAIPFFDVPIALCALGAKLKILGPNGDRTGDIRKFFLNMFTPDLRDDELLLEVILPRESKNTASSFLKIGRTAYDYGVVSVATKIRLDEDGRCIGANVYFGNVDIVPYRAEEAEGMLKGKFIDKEVIERAMDMVPRIEPSPTIHASSEYKKEVMKVLLRDSLRIALDRVSKRCDL